MSTPGNPRVAIIGAGPSGLTIAFYLKALGLDSVQIFEAQKEVGGQSVTHDVDGFPVEMGTVYLTDGYILAKQIARKVGCPAEVLPKATVLAGKRDKKGDVVTVRPPVPPFSVLARYVFSWLRWYLGGQMRRPSRPDNALRFSDWLNQNGFDALTDSFVFTAGMTAQLYGPLNAVSAHSGLNWMRPSLLVTGKFEQTAHIPQGFQVMWEKLAQHLDYRIHFGQTIDAVRPTDAGGRRRVELLDGGERIAEPFDHVFLACPLDHMEDHPLDVEGNPLKPIEHPLSSAVQEHPFEAAEVYSAAWRATNWPEVAKSRCYLPSASSTKEADLGRLLTIRQYGNVGGRYVGQLCSYAIPDGETSEKRLADNPRRLEENRAKVVADMENLVGLKEIEILHDRLWRYNIRYSHDQLEGHLPILIDDSQGQQGIWYTGGTLSHWNIDAITDYNHKLAKRFAQRIGLPWLTRLKLFRLADLVSDL